MHVTKMHLAFANANIARSGAPLAKRVLTLLDQHTSNMQRQAREAAVKAAEARLAREKELARLATSTDAE